MQSSIAILTSLGLLFFKVWPFRKKHRAKRHMHALVMAAIEFQKKQCYFAGTIQIAAMFFLGNQSVISQQISTQSTIRDIMDVNILPAVSANGYVPVMFTLTLIAHYSKQSWYLILLSFSVLGLSTGFLVYFGRLSKSFQSLGISPLTTFGDKYVDGWNLGMYC